MRKPKTPKNAENAKNAENGENEIGKNKKISVTVTVSNGVF